jgi:hypothetical protein
MRLGMYWSTAMIAGLTILGVLTLIAISEIRKAQGHQFKVEE